MTASARAEGTADDDPTLLERDPRLCRHLRDNGEYCKAFATKTTGLCAGHSRMGIAADPAAAQKQSAQGRRQKADARKRTAKDVYRDAVNDNAEAFVAARLLIIGDTNAPASDRLKAMEQLETRGMGRPTEHVETTITVPETVQQLHDMTPAERSALLARLSEGRRLHVVNDD